MPRPKRTKLAPSTPVPTTRVQTSNTTTIGNTPSSPKSSIRDATNSDDSEGLVKVNKSGVNRRGIAKKNARMSGALAIEDSGGTRWKPLTGRRRAAISKIARDADHAKAIEGLKKRKEEAEAKHKNQQAILPARMPEARQNEQQSIVPSSMPEIDAVGPKSHMESKQIAHVGTIEKAWPVPILKVPATPTADTSILALANFKRRPRQPSILQIGREDPAEETDNDDLDDFEPNDESTPFHLSRSRYDVQHTSASHTSSSQKMLSSGSRKRKLTSPEVQISPITQIPSSPAQQVGQMSILDSNPYQSPHYDQDILKPGLPITKSRRPVTPEIWSDTMAPPQSSSPLQKTPPTPPTHVTNATPAKKPNRQQPRRKPISKSPAPPCSISKLKDSRPLQALKPMTTASLQNLLPRRKRHVQTNTDEGFDLPNSSDVELDTTCLGEYEDEISFAKPTVKKGGKKNNRFLPQPKSKGKTTKRTAAPIIKPSKLSPRKATPGKTYTRRLSDKENPPKDRQEKQPTSVSKSKSKSSILHNHDLTLDSLENSSILDANEDEEDRPTSPAAQTSPAKKGTKDEDKGSGSKELKEMARKFREVDRWEMDFEEVTASSSSPRDAR